MPLVHRGRLAGGGLFGRAVGHPRGWVATAGTWPRTFACLQSAYILRWRRNAPSKACRLSLGGVGGACPGVCGLMVCAHMSLRGRREWRPTIDERQAICDLLQLPAYPPFQRIRLDARSALQPLSLATSRNLGVLPRSGVPSLVDHMLDDEAPAAARRLVRRWLLAPRDAEAVEAMRQLLRTAPDRSRGWPCAATAERRERPSSVRGLPGSDRAQRSHKFPNSLRAVESTDQEM